ncbi:hypothetical protein PQQ51_14910 [Paraburkholderia xenovorans]|uniref:hypothetical protein n=1 Tax=Paraburkholderia xenovorans TaxID=36873 RepID=UPI0038B762FF
MPERIELSCSHQKIVGLVVVLSAVLIGLIGLIGLVGLVGRDWGAAAYAAARFACLDDDDG